MSYIVCNVLHSMKLLSCVRLFATPWAVAHQAHWSMGFSRHEYRGGLPFPSSGDLPYPGIEPRSPTLQEYALPSELPGNWGIIIRTRKFILAQYKRPISISPTFPLFFFSVPGLIQGTILYLVVISPQYKKYYIILSHHPQF